MSSKLINSYDLTRFTNKNHINTLRAGYNAALSKLDRMEVKLEIKIGAAKTAYAQEINQHKDYIRKLELVIDYEIEQYCKNYVNKLTSKPFVKIMQSDM